MARLRYLFVTAALIVGVCLAVAHAAGANPLSDISREKWAYQAIQSLAADGVIEGYPDGTFKGDRPLSRSEMAVVVARAIAKIQAGGASKADVQKVQELINGLKDELDGLGVRVTNLEDSMQALQERTKVAQALTFSGDLRPNLAFRQIVTAPRTIANYTNAACTPPTAPTCGATSPADALVTTFLLTDPSNNVFDPALSGIHFRYNDKFTIGYQIGDNLNITFPIRILSYEYGGPFEQQQHYGVSPGVAVRVAKAGDLNNFVATFGDLDNMKPSLAGLAFRPPHDVDYAPYGAPLQAFAKGISLAGTLGGLTDFYFSIGRLDQTYLYSSNGTGVLDPTGYGTNAVLFPVTLPQSGYVQRGPPGGNITSNTFTAGANGLQQVFLSRKAVLGSVYISSCNGSRFNAQGQFIGGVSPAPGSFCAGVPGVNFTYNDAYNNVTFTTGLPPGVTVTLSYSGVDALYDTGAQRYMITSRINHQIRALPGSSVGLTFNRIFDLDNAQIIGGEPAPQHSLVSDTVFGLDFQFPLLARMRSSPAFFAEAASSRLRNDGGSTSGSFSTATRSDSALVFGLKFKTARGTGQVAYQTIGANFLAGTPLRYFGNAPNVFSYSTLPYFPAFFGLANNLMINRRLDAALGAGSTVSVNPALTYAYPIFNSFQAFGPNFYSAYVPNTQGLAATFTTPVRVGSWNVQARLSAQHLAEIAPNSFGTMQYCAGSVAGGCAYRSAVKQRDDAITLGTAFNVRALGKPVSIDLSGTYERLSREDKTGFPYVPYNPTLQSADPAVTAALPGGVSPVRFYPNFADVKKRQFNVDAAFPLTKDMTVNLQYNTQSYAGAYQTTLNQNIAQHKDYYLGNVTYSIPKTNSAIVFTTRQYTYRDNYLPSYNLTQNRQDLNFTVKF
ncbi:MAG: S-layer homology domain-containing protein [Candidatus Eremiobacteraeota bacterium]|nr:S-layer homology domain-containing protein [Candidatus Eremiobacteraeota bacterium]